MTSAKRPDLTCPNCGTRFSPNKNQRYCSRRCVNAVNGPRIRARNFPEKLCRRCREYYPRDHFTNESFKCRVCLTLERSGMKRCGSCKAVKDAADFYRSPKGALKSWCRGCEAVAAAERLADPTDTRRRRDKRLRRTFGIGADTFDAMLEAQGGVCAVCGEPPNGSAFHVDHDHSCCPGGRGTQTCGQCIRGITCPTCNAGLGYFKDSIERLKAAALYLESSGLGIRT